MNGRQVGVYIPPFRLKQLQQQEQDKASADYQRMTWEALKKSLNGYVNKVPPTDSNLAGVSWKYQVHYP